MAALVAATVASGAGCRGDDDGDARPKASASSTTSTAPLGDEAFPGIWPYTTSAEADGYTRGVVDETYLDPVRTAREFMRAYGGMKAPMAGEFRAGDPQSGEVEVRPKPTSPFVTTVLVQRVAGGDSPWVVVGAVANRIQVVTPVALDQISSPVLVSGRSSAFEGNVLVQVKEDGMGPDDFLGQEPLIGGSGEALEPFSGRVAYNVPSRPAGAVVAFTTSAEDGSVEQLSAIRVRFQRAQT